MNISDLQKRKGESGFTLVELAIVMIIIGLLIGGILKGQELIANAAVTSTAAQVKGFEAAFSTFADKYNATPGDMLNATNRLPNCLAAPCLVAAPNGNGRIDATALGALPGAANENGGAFVQLAAADLITGLIPANGLIFGGQLPEANIDGGFWIGHTADGSAGGLAAGSLRPGHYLVLNEALSAITAAGTDGVSTTQAGRIDRKLDDGDPATGNIWSVGTGCIAAGIYDEKTESGADCSMYIRIQG